MRSFAAVLKKLGLGVCLLSGAAALLLYSDLGSRTGAAKGAKKQLAVAIVQQNSVQPLDDTITGALQALKQRGYSDGGRIALHRYNAQGDIGTANAIAKEVTSGDYDLIFTSSTISLQTVANANRFASTPRRHVFAAVADPYAVGVGVSRENHSIHPPYMTGLGSLAPVAEIFQLAKQIHPGLKRVGIVWDPAEANSVVVTKLARSVCAAQGIELIEANAENTTAVGEAISSVLTHNVDAIWISTDLVAQNAHNVIEARAAVARIPVFSSFPSGRLSGTLFDLGANYIEVGHLAGNLAADVLDGKDPATIPVENRMPKIFHVNLRELKNLREHWEIPDAVLKQANVVVDDAGRHEQTPVSTEAN